MALIKLNNRAVKDIDAVGSIGTGDLVFISKQTASSDASISFTSGIDSTYKEYVFFFKNLHPQTNGQNLTFQADTGTNTNYNQTITSTFYYAYHNEAGNNSVFGYVNSYDQAQGTNFQRLLYDCSSDADHSANGYLHVYNPSSTTFVKHFMSRLGNTDKDDYQIDSFCAGYFNTTTAITRFQFKFASGNIDSGDILLYGVN